MVITAEHVLVVLITLLGADSIGRAAVNAWLESRRRHQLDAQGRAEAERRQREAEDAGRRAAQQVLEDQGLKRIGDLERAQTEWAGRADRAEARAAEAEKRELAAEERATEHARLHADALARLEREAKARHQAEASLDTERGEKAELVRQLTELRASYTRLESENAALQLRTNGLQNEIDQLRRQIAALTANQERVE